MPTSQSLRSSLFILVLLCVSAACFAQVGVAITIGPPPIPVYDQPVCPGDGYMWTPGYWAYDYDYNDYYWVPGTWVLAPEVGFLWTPGWWGWGGDAFIFHEGFWGPQIGFYGGINYGFGYFGTGFFGGEWRGGTFFYNTAVVHVNTTVIRNVYENRTVIVNNNHVAYNGGEGGVTARATAQDEAAERGRHIPPIAAQTQQAQAARGNPELRASANHGKPPVAATAKPGEFTGHDVVAARDAGGPYNPPANRGGAARNNAAAEHPEANVPHGAAVHPNELPPNERPAAPNTGDKKLDQKYQKQQDKLIANQNKERQKLQQKQDQEHQKATNDAQKQQLEQKHQQQTQQLQQKHVQQQQQMQTRQQPRAEPRK
jgi:YXWGXW repeat-containing protein